MAGDRDGRGWQGLSCPELEDGELQGKEQMHGVPSCEDVSAVSTCE